MTAKKKVAKTKHDPSDPLTPVRIFVEEMEAMDTRCVEVVRLAHARGAKAEAIAEVMGVSPRTIYSRLEGITPNGRKL